VVRGSLLEGRTPKQIAGKSAAGIVAVITAVFRKRDFKLRHAITFDKYSTFAKAHPCSRERITT